MASEANNNVFSAADIQRYHEGRLSPRERHAMEKAALDNPFLADALEGFGGAGDATETDLADLRQRLAKRIEEGSNTPLVLLTASRSRGVPGWLKIAAVAVFIAGTATLVYRFNRGTAPKEIAQESPIQSDKTDTIREATVSSGTDHPASITPNPATPPSTPHLPSAATVSPPAPGGTSVPLHQESAGLVRTESEPGRSTGNGLVSAPVQSAAKAFDADAKKDQAVVEEPVSVNGYRSAAKQRQLSTTNDQVNATANVQRNSFTGRVLDEQNNALPFSNITNLDDNVGTYSDARGYFNFTSPDSVLNVRVRSVGFESSVVTLRSFKTENRITLQEDRNIAVNVLDTTRRNFNRSRTSSMVLEEPEPVDGWSNYDTYLTNNLQAPELRTANGSSGEVELSFDVDVNGHPTNITVTRSLCERCDREAIRLVKEGPKWKRKLKHKRASLTVNF